MRGEDVVHLTEIVVCVIPVSRFHCALTRVMQ